jgi:hypothetical protein
MWGALQLAICGDRKMSHIDDANVAPEAQSEQRYDYRNCQSLFGYAANVHIRSGGVCQLCGCGGAPLTFDLWRQMTVEHIVGASQGGYLKEIRLAVASRFAELSAAACEELSQRIDELNTVTACSFCNSTTSGDESPKSMHELLQVQGGVDEVITSIASELQCVLDRKRKDVEWKIASVKEAFENEVLPNIISNAETKS